MIVAPDPRAPDSRAPNSRARPRAGGGTLRLLFAVNDPEVDGRLFRRALGPRADVSVHVVADTRDLLEELYRPDRRLPALIAMDPVLMGEPLPLDLVHCLRRGLRSPRPPLLLLSCACGGSQPANARLTRAVDGVVCRENVSAWLAPLVDALARGSTWRAALGKFHGAAAPAPSPHAG